LLASVIAYFNPRRIILFGSRARGDAETDSDLDLLVILDDDARPELLSWRAGYEARKAYHRAVDIVPCRASMFEDKVRVVGSLAHTAETEGVVVYKSLTRNVLCIFNELEGCPRQETRRRRCRSIVEVR
jgi:predicted nucleotidyltransferase